MSSAKTLPRVYLGAWCVYLVLVPFYLLGKTPVPGRDHPEGGVPQVADYFMVGLMGLVLTTRPARLLRLAVPVVTAGRRGWSAESTRACNGWRRATPT